MSVSGRAWRAAAARLEAALRRLLDAASSGAERGAPSIPEALAGCALPRVRQHQT